MRGLLSTDRTLEGARKHWLLRLVSGVGLSSCVFATSNTAVAATEAHANDPVELAWVRLEGAEVCPPRSAFVAALEKRVGSSQVVMKAARVLTVSLSNEKGPFRAVLSLKSKPSDEVESKQELFSYSSSCDEVFAATVLSVALLLNPDEFGNSQAEAPIVEHDNGFFDPPPNQPIGAPSPPSAPSAPGTTQPEPEPEFDIPVAPRPWARSHVFIGASALAAIEQLPTAGPGFAARIELPLDRAWLLWFEGDWLQSQPVPSSGGPYTGVSVVQDAGWLGVSWLPYNNEAFEFHVGGGAGVRRLVFTLTDDVPRMHVALQLGIGAVFYLIPSLALQAQAAAVVPLHQEKLREDLATPSPNWSQPPVGGQLQLGFLLEIPGPS